MHRRYFLAVVATLLPAGAAHADLPLPDNLKYADPQVAFEGIGEHADYVFHLRYLTSNGGPSGVPHRLLPVKDSKAFPLNAERRLFEMQLLAMNRQEFEKRAKDDKSLAWLTDETKGVLVAKVDPPSTVVAKTSTKPPMSTYQIKLKDGKLTVEEVARTKADAGGGFGILPQSMAGLALAGALASLGLVIVRRRSSDHAGGAA